MSILKLLASSNYLTVSKDLIKKLGTLEALMIGELASEFEYWNTRDELDEEGYFFSTIDNIETVLCIPRKQQKVILDNLQKKKILDIKLKGIPAKRYIKFNEKELVTLLGIQLGQNGQTCMAKMDKLVSPKWPTNNNINNKNINNNKYSVKNYKKYSQRDLSKLENLYTNLGGTNDRE